MYKRWPLSSLGKIDSTSKSSEHTGYRSDRDSDPVRDQPTSPVLLNHLRRRGQTELKGEEVPRAKTPLPSPRLVQTSGPRLAPVKVRAWRSMLARGTKTRLPSRRHPAGPLCRLHTTLTPKGQLPRQ